MGRPKEPSPAKLFTSLIASEASFYGKGMEDLKKAFGGVDYVSERFPFCETDYYAEEMGRDLFRHFITFENLIPIPLLPEIKQKTNRIEEKYADGKGARRINIDPGYLCLQHVVLATTKGYTHRPYLRDGIYADLTLIFQKRSFRPLEWTYPDYRQEAIIQLFNQVRSRYLEDLRAEGVHPC